MYAFLKVIVFLIQLLVALCESNPMCLPDFTIDSAFVDKYSDLGSDVITLFSDTTVHQLNIDSNETIQYKRSIPLNEWSKGIVGPITCVYYKYYGNIIGVENRKLSNKWEIWSKNKTIKGQYKPDCSYPSIIVEKLVILPFDWKRSTIFIEKNILIQSEYWLIGSNRDHHDHMYLIRELKNNAINNMLTIDEIEGYLNKTTAGFAFNDYVYLFAGNRVCRMDNITLEFADNCLNQTIAQWIRCGEMDNKTNTWIIIIIISVIAITAVIIVLMVCLLYSITSDETEETDTSSKQNVYPKYKRVDQMSDSVHKTVSIESISSAESDNRPTDLRITRPKPMK